MRIILLIIMCVLLLVGQTPPVEVHYLNLYSVKKIIPDMADMYGVVSADFDMDSYPDLYMTSFRNLNRLLLNRNAGTAYRDETIETGLGGNLMPMGIRNLELGNAIFDWDNDGDQDVLICGWGEATRFYQNEGNLQFTDITDLLNLEGPYDFNDAVTADVNNDGYIDLFFTDEHFNNRLLLNRFGLEYEAYTKASGLDRNGISQTATFSDVDLDGDQDLYVSNWDEEDWFYENNGNGIFVLKQPDIRSVYLKNSSNSASFADVDNDGDFDLFVATRNGPNHLYINRLKETDAAWMFIEEENFISPNIYSNSYGGNFADVDLDGWLDLYITDNGSNVLYLNDHLNHFIPVMKDTLTYGAPAYSTGSSFADIDLDGDVDLIVANKDTFSVLYENTTNSDSYISFQIEGILSNANAIGTRINLVESHSNKIVASRELNGGTAYLSQNEMKVIFGVDPDLRYQVEVYFPSGKSVTRSELSAPAAYQIAEFSSPEKEIRSMLYSSWAAIRSFDFWIRIIQWVVISAIVIFVFYFALKKYLVRKTEEALRKEYLIQLEEKNIILKEKNQELQSAQSQLVLSEKMASLGRLVAGVAHELNNPISFIYANVHQLKDYTRKLSRENPKAEEVKKLIKEIDELIEETQKGSLSVKELVKNLRRFSHVDSEEWRSEDVHNGLETSLLILRPEIKKGIEVIKNYGDIDLVECHPGEINQVFLNILTNAVQAIGEKGILNIDTYQEGDSVKIEIADNGKGIDPEHLANIFDPFYSTKEVGEGTGLGLSISMTIINKHKGNIEVKSKKGQGTKFIITLPVSQKSKGD